MLKQPFSTRMTVLALVFYIGIAALSVATGQYARTEQVRGILVTDQPSSKVFAQHLGLVTGWQVSGGKLVRQGDLQAAVHNDLVDERERAPHQAARKQSDALYAADLPILEWRHCAPVSNIGAQLIRSRTGEVLSGHYRHRAIDQSDPLANRRKPQAGRLTLSPAVMVTSSPDWNCV